MVTGIRFRNGKTKFRKSHFGFGMIYLILIVYIVFVPELSDYETYEHYYNSITWYNFTNFSFEKGYILIGLLAAYFKIPFIVFWKIINILCIIMFYNFLAHRQTHMFKISTLSALLFILLNPYSLNLFSNIIRNTISVALFLYILRKDMRWYYYILPLFFHISSVLLILAVYTYKLTRRRSLSSYSIIVTMILPLFGFLLQDEILEFIPIFGGSRSIMQQLTHEYVPAYRLLSYFLFLKVVCIGLYLLWHVKRGHSPSWCSRIYFSLSLRELNVLYYYFAFSLFSYWAFLGIGYSARILTYPVWLGSSLWFSFFIVTIVSVVRNASR